MGKRRLLVPHSAVRNSLAAVHFAMVTQMHLVAAYFPTLGNIRRPHFMRNGFVVRSRHSGLYVLVEITNFSFEVSLRQALRIGGKWYVSKIALEMYLDGDTGALRCYLRGDRARKDVVAYFNRFGLFAQKPVNGG
jgi:hypothetical protein